MHSSLVLQRAFDQVKCRRRRGLTVGVLNSGSNSPRTLTQVRFTALCSWVKYISYYYLYGYSECDAQGLPCDGLSCHSGREVYSQSYSYSGNRRYERWSDWQVGLAFHKSFPSCIECKKKNYLLKDLCPGCEECKNLKRIVRLLILVWKDCKWKYSTQFTAPHVKQNSGHFNSAETTTSKAVVDIATVPRTLVNVCVFFTV